MAHCLESYIEPAFYHSSAKARPRPQGNGLAADSNIWCRLHIVGVLSLALLGRHLPYAEHFLRGQALALPPHLPAGSQMRSRCSPPKELNLSVRTYLFFLQGKEKTGGEG